MRSATRIVIGVLIRLGDGQEDVRLGRLAEEHILHPAHDADDLDDRAVVAAETEPFAERRLARPDGFHQCIVDDRPPAARSRRHDR